VAEALDGALLLLFAAPEQVRNGDVSQDFRQSSDFYYLTGLEEPEAALALSGGPSPEFVLFLRPRDPERERWDGARLGLEGATATLGADVAYPIGELESRLVELMKGRRTIYYAFGEEPRHDQLVQSVLRRVRAAARRSGTYPRHLSDPGTILHELRLIKDEAELDATRRAIHNTEEAFSALLTRTRPGMLEYELEAMFFERIRARGSARLAFPTIVASGPNATVLHHRKNDRRLRDGELVLVDAGAEVDYLSADVTRTFPVGTDFGVTERVLYELVLAAQTRAIARVAPGVTLEQIHAASLEELSRGLVDLGIVEGPVERVLEEKLHQKYTVHRTSHFLGMDVHDVGGEEHEGAPRKLRPGMLLTVEPGLYFPSDDPELEPRFRGIGIRIEDDVRVSADGCEVLSRAIPKSVDELLRMRRA